MQINRTSHPLQRYKFELLYMHVYTFIHIPNATLHLCVYVCMYICTGYMQVLVAYAMIMVIKIYLYSNYNQNTNHIRNGDDDLTYLLHLETFIDTIVNFNRSSPLLIGQLSYESLSSLTIQLS